jgi:phage/plasmid primase-like uncharacterized protein
MGDTMITAVLLACAANVAPITLAAVIRVESAGNPLALHVNSSVGPQPHPMTLADAVNLAERAIRLGYSVDLGLMQVNSRNLAALGYSIRQALDPCTNIRGGARILTADYAEAAQKRHDRAREREQQAERIAQQVDAMWTAATPTQAHPYLAEKDVQAHGTRQDAEGRLIVPLRDADGRIWSLQRIGNDGFKQFQEGGRVEGGHFVIGDVRQSGPLLIAEGFATAATLHEMSGMPAIVAFNAGNLLPVALTYRGLYSDRAIYIAGDNDWQRETERDAQGRLKINVGRVKAEEAAAAIAGQAVLPVFPRDSLGTDWNDLARAQGRTEAAGQFRLAMAIGDREQVARSLEAAREQPGPDQEHGLSHPVGQALGRTGKASSRDRDRTPVQEIAHER